MVHTLNDFQWQRKHSCSMGTVFILHAYDLCDQQNVCGVDLLESAKSGAAVPGSQSAFNFSLFNYALTKRKITESRLVSMQSWIRFCTHTS